MLARKGYDPKEYYKKLIQEGYKEKCVRCGSSYKPKTIREFFLKYCQDCNQTYREVKNTPPITAEDVLNDPRAILDSIDETKWKSRKNKKWNKKWEKEKIKEVVDIFNKEAGLISCDFSRVGKLVARNKYTYKEVRYLDLPIEYEGIAIVQIFCNSWDLDNVNNISNHFDKEAIIGAFQGERNKIIVLTLKPFKKKSK